MKQIYKLLVATSVGILLSACASTNSSNIRPAWIDNPGNGVSASAGMNVKGRVAQEELAISRARIEYAKTFGVSIGAGQIIETKVANGRSSTVSNSVAVEGVNQSDIKAIVKAKWRDEEADVLWVWLVPAN